MSSIDFDLTKIKALVLDVDGVLSPSTVPLTESGQPQKMCNVKDGYALQLAAKHSFPIAVISGGYSEAVANRMHLLGIKDVRQRVADKLPELKKWMDANDLRKEEVAYVGDDIPDLRCLREAGLPCCPFDASWEVKQECKYISPFSGGYGVVRDILEQILKAHNIWETESLKNLVW